MSPRIAVDNGPHLIVEERVALVGRVLRVLSDNKPHTEDQLFHTTGDKPVWCSALLAHLLEIGTVEQVDSPMGTMYRCGPLSPRAISPQLLYERVFERRFIASQKRGKIEHWDLADKTGSPVTPLLTPEAPSTETETPAFGGAGEFEQWVVEAIGGLRDDLARVVEFNVHVGKMVEASEAREIGRDATLLESIEDVTDTSRTWTRLDTLERHIDAKLGAIQAYIVERIDAHAAFLAEKLDGQAAAIVGAAEAHARDRATVTEALARVARQVERVLEQSEIVAAKLSGQIEEKLNHATRDLKATTKQLADARADVVKDLKERLIQDELSARDRLESLKKGAPKYPIAAATILAATDPPMAANGKATS